MLKIIKMNDKKLIEPLVLITDDYFRLYSPIPKNYNLEDIRPYYKIAETIWIVPILGLPLYEQLLEQVAKNEVTEENSTLLLVLYPFLAFSILYECMPFVSYKLTEVGLVVGHSDNSTAAPVSGLNIIHNRLRSTVETLKNNFVKWLNDHSDNFPLYTPDTCQCITECSECDWIQQYYNGGYLKHNWNYFMNKSLPNTRLQTFSTPRRNIDLV